MSAALIKSLLKRPVAYHPIFKQVAGSTVGGVFLSQAYYWSTGDRYRWERGGWFYKIQAEWTEETGLTRSEQERARRDLKKLGLLRECRRDSNGRMYFKLVKDLLYKLIGENVAHCKPKGKSNQIKSVQDSALDDDLFKELEAENEEIFNDFNTMLESAVETQDSAVASAESCTPYTESTTENTSEITAAVVQAVNSVLADMLQGGKPSSVQPAAADSSHSEEVVVQGWQSQSADPVERVQPASVITPDSSETVPNASQMASNPSGPFQADDATDQGPTGALARMPMSGDWLPDSDRLKRLCRMRGVSLKNLSPERYQDLLCEFRTYRVSEGLTLSQHKWEVKLVDQLLWYQRNRPEAFAGDLAGDQAGVSNLADRAQPFNRESRHGKSSSSASGRGKPRNSAERLAASCAGAFDYFQSQSGGQSQSQSLSAEQAAELPNVQRAEPECIGAGSSVGIGIGALTDAGIVTDSSTRTDTGTSSGGSPTQGEGAIQPAASDTTTSRSDAGFGVGQSSAAGEVSRAEGGEVRAVESCSGQARSGDVSVTGWRDETNGVLGGGVVNPPPTRFGDIWDNPSMWPVR